MRTGCPKLTDQECEYYLIQYPDVCKDIMLTGKNRLECARKHWKTTGCKEGRNYKLPATCKYTLTDEEAICYIRQNNLNYKLVGNDLHKAREHWKTKGCINNLNYSCPNDSAISAIAQNLKVSENQLADLSVEYKADHDANEKRIQDILKMEVTSLPFVFENVKIQNDVLKTQLQKTKDEKLTNNQGTLYTETRLANLVFFNTVLFWIYYIFLFIFAFFLFFVKEFVFADQLYTNISLIFGLAIFPFVAYWVEYVLWVIGHYTYSFTYSKLF